MNRIRMALLFALALALASCDGGSRGSGITTAQGNVDSVMTALRGTSAPTLLARLRSALTFERTAHAQSALGGIHVMIEGTTIEDETDAQGLFTLRGNFEGDVVIRFEHMAGGPAARITLNVPAAGTLTLNDVRLDEQSGQATARQLDVAFEGLVAGSDCAGNTLRLVSRHRGPTDTDVYTIRLDTSSLHDKAGAPVSCDALRDGDTAVLHGTVNPDGTFGQADIEIS
jgi:hypothetical protein